MNDEFWLRMGEVPSNNFHSRVLSGSMLRGQTQLRSGEVDMISRGFSESLTTNLSSWEAKDSVDQDGFVPEQHLMPGQEFMESSDQVSNRTKEKTTNIAHQPA